MEKRIVLFSDIIQGEYRNTLLEIANTFGYGVQQISSEDEFLSSLKNIPYTALILDFKKFETFNGATDYKDVTAGHPVFLVAESTESEINIDRGSYDGFILSGVSRSIFEKEIISVFKYIVIQSRLKSASKIIDPEFLRKLLGDTAHAINNILTGIQGYAELAALNPGDEQLIKDSFKVILDSSYRIRNEIKNLRAFVRIENPILERIPLSDILLQSIDFIKPQCRLKNCEIKFNFERDYIIEGDKDQLVQVFFNVFHDLVENSPEGSNIEIGMVERGSKVILNLNCKDYRIEEDEYQSIKRILSLNEPVLKMDSEEGEIENKNVLSMCGRIMFNHRGSINLINVRDEYVYEIELPFIKVVEPAKKEEEGTKRATEELPEGAFTGESIYNNLESLDMDILVVDDEEFIRNTLYYFFEQRGCRVTLAEDGKYGLEMAKEKPYDIIFMDYLMPKMGGIESAKEILRERGDARIVFITGKDTANEEDILNAGVYAVIKKPFEIEEIYSIAKKIAMEKGLGG